MCAPRGPHVLLKSPYEPYRRGIDPSIKSQGPQAVCKATPISTKSIQLGVEGDKAATRLLSLYWDEDGPKPAHNESEQSVARKI